MTPFLPSRSVGRSNRGGARNQRQFLSQHPTNPRSAVADDSEQATNRVNHRNCANGPRGIGGSRNNSNGGRKSRNENRTPPRGCRGYGKTEYSPRSSKISESLHISTDPSPFGVGLTNQDRADAVLRWNLTPGNIASGEAQARENNRALRLAREAREEATGMKEPPPVQPSLVESFKRMGVQVADGKMASREAVGKEIRGYEMATPMAIESAPVAPPSPAPGLTYQFALDDQCASVFDPRTKPSSCAAVFDNGTNEAGEVVIRIRPPGGASKDVVLGGVGGRLGESSHDNEMVVV